MCGIFGGIGNNVSPGIIRALALINRERGTDSLGFFDNTAKLIKIALDPVEALAHADFNVFIERACSKGWFVAGHTRNATHGTVISENAHPFRYGRIIGAHNGIVSTPKDSKYVVDSEYLFDSLNRHNGNYQAGLEDISGYWGLSWFDGADFYLQAHDNTVYVAQAENSAWYYSSDVVHLNACIGKHGEVLKMHDGMTIRFSLDTPGFTVMPALTVKAQGYYSRFYRSVTNGGKKSKKHKNRNVTATWPRGHNPSVSIVPTAASADAKARGYMEDSMLTDFDAMARAVGYSGAEDFMIHNGFHDEHKAMAYLEDSLYVERAAERTRAAACDDGFDVDAYADYVNRDQGDHRNRYDDDNLLF